MKYFNRSTFALSLLFISASIHLIGQEVPIIFKEQNGQVAVEAEYFSHQTNNELRQWYLISKNNIPTGSNLNEYTHFNKAGNNSFLKILPDTRVTHDDQLIKGENFSNEAGKIAILHYQINFENPGRYYIWVRAFSSGSEDNGIHVGIDGAWPESGQRMQWCKGKNSWKWDSKQRTQAVHCGEPYLIYLDIEKAGFHDIQFSMREDGFQFDKFLMTIDKLYTPINEGIEVKLFSGNLIDLNIEKTKNTE